MSRKITVLTKDRPYDGFFKIDRYRLRQEANGVSFDLTRELFERGHAAALLPYDPVLDAVLVVEEFRIGNMAAGLPEEQWFSPGPIAGMIDPGETPVEAAIREGAEEAGLSLSEADLLPGITILPSPGGSSETVTLILALTDLSGVRPGVHGEGSEAEMTWTRILPRTELLDLIGTRPTTGHLTALAMRLEMLRLSGQLPEAGWRNGPATVSAPDPEI